MNNMENLNILITGASGGIGTSLSKAFSSTKANLFLLGSSDEKISSLREELPSKENIRFFTVDLSQRENVNNFCDSVIEEFGGISVVINNAGITQDSLFMRMSDCAWDEVFAINLDASMAIIRKFIRGMIKNKWGRIVNISSGGSVNCAENYFSYSSSKAALNTLAKTLSKEIKDYNIKINSMSPGPCKTPMFPNNKLSTKLSLPTLEYLTSLKSNGPSGKFFWFLNDIDIFPDLKHINWGKPKKLKK